MRELDVVGKPLNCPLQRMAWGLLRHSTADWAIRYAGSTIEVEVDGR